MLTQTIIEVLSNQSVWIALTFLLVSGWLMERIITRMALLCRSVHVVHVPWGILVITVLAYLTGFIDYKAVVVMALFYLVSYPSMWYLNYRFTRDLEKVLKEKHITHENTEISIWPEEIAWIRYLKRKIVKRKLDEETINWILDYDSRNGFSSRYGHPIKDTTRDN